MKKTYIAIMGDDDGKSVGTVVISSWRWKNPKWFYDKVAELVVSNHNIIDFKRLK